jgi:tryptophan synthase beta chain
MRVRAAIKADMRDGHFGAFGGRYVPETLMAPLLELEEAYHEASADTGFHEELGVYLRDYAGRPTPLYLSLIHI